MPLTLSRIKLLKYILVFSLGIITGNIFKPVWSWLLIYSFQEAYQDATYQCDRSMRNHLIAQQNVANSPSEETLIQLSSAEVALIDCQDYDLLRKRLLISGLSEIELGYMALQAIEAKATDLQDVIEVHEIRY